MYHDICGLFNKNAPSDLNKILFDIFLIDFIFITECTFDFLFFLSIITNIRINLYLMTSKYYVFIGQITNDVVHPVYLIMSP